MNAQAVPFPAERRKIGANAFLKRVCEEHAAADSSPVWRIGNGVALATLPHCR